MCPADSRHTAFLAWWAAQPAERLSALVAFNRKVSAPKSPHLCARTLGLCLGCQSVGGGNGAAITRPSSATLTPEDVATPDALASWRAQHGVGAVQDAGVCGPSRSGRAPRDCALWLGDVGPDALATFATREPGSLVMSTPSFGAALQTYLSQRLLCRECRLHVQGAWAAVQHVHARCVAAGQPCGCTADFCTALAEDTPGAPGWWPHGVVSLTAAGHLTGRWDAHAFTAAGQPPVFTWSVGTSSGSDDVQPWTQTAHGGADASIDAHVTLPEPRRGGEEADEVAVDVYINVRAACGDGNAEAATCLALRMDGRECVHLRMVFDDARGTVGLTTETEEDMRCFMQYASRLQQEDEMEAEADLMAPAVGGNNDPLPTSMLGGAMSPNADDPAFEDAHVDTPELAAEALLDAACVIIKQRAEHAYRRAAAASHVERLMAAAQADQVEQALRTAFREMHAEAQAAELLAELDLESQAAAAKKPGAATTPGGKRGKKAKQATPPAARKAVSDEPPEQLPPPPQAPPTPPPQAQSVPPLAPVTPRTPLPQQQPDDSVLPASPQTPTGTQEAGGEQWSEQTSRRRRRLSNASRMSNGSRDSLVSAGEEGGSHVASPGRVSPVEGHAPMQPMSSMQQRQPAAARQVMGPLSQLPPPPPAAWAQWPALQQAARRWPPQPAPLPAAPPPLPPPSLPLPTPPQARHQVSEAVPPAFASTGAPAPPVRVMGSSAAAFYTGTGFGLFQLPIGGGNGQQGSLF